MDKYDEDKNNALSSLFLESDKPDDINCADDILAQEEFSVDLDSVNSLAMQQATEIVDKLSGYYFDEKYLKNHPYIPQKIAQCEDSIRRLLKMLEINEKAQDRLIVGISFNSGKGSMYQSLTSLQNSMLSIQKELNGYVDSLEDIFRKMQEECDRTFEDKDKEITDDGSIVVRGSRDFIKSINEMIQQNASTTKDEESTSDNVEKKIE